MELSLHGSHINLATRYKPNTVNVNYPKVGSRPGSANCSVVNSSGLIKNSRALSLKRPLSADSRLLKNFENLGKKFDDNGQSGRPNSSSNILKLLLSEPIKRKSWSSESSDRNHISENKNLCKISQSKTMQQMGSDGTSEDSSVEEEIEEVQSAEDENIKEIKLDNWRQTSVDERESSLKPGIKSKPPLPSTSDRLRKLRPENHNQDKENNNYEDGRILTTNNHSRIKTQTSISPSTSRTKSVTFKAWFDEQPKQPSESCSRDKIDLPGRVSFSTNDVFEIDYSDYDNETESAHSNDENKIDGKKNVHFYDEFYNSKLKDRKTNREPLQANDKDENIANTKRNEFYCSSKCCTFQHTTQDTEICTKKKNNSKLDDWKKSDEKSDYTNNNNKIIEDYKKEIETINRRHEFELHLANSNNDSISPLPNKTNLPKYYNNEFRLQNSKTRQLDELHNDLSNSIAEEPLILKENSNVIQEYYESVTMVTPINADGAQLGKKLENIEDTTVDSAKQSDAEIFNESSVAKHGKSMEFLDDTWNNNNTNNNNKPIQTSTPNIPLKPSIKLDTANEIINNYLKVTEQKTIDKTLANGKKQNNLPKKQTKEKSGREMVRKQKSVTSGKASGKRTTTTMDKLKKSKSTPNLLDDSRLNEFQIDKIDSWMSIHDDNLSEINENINKILKMKTNDKEYSKEWSETPNSKTDDEGNFSLDEPNDNSSNISTINESTYEDILSVIKEIDDDKRKQLHSDIEFKLNTLITTTTSSSPSSNTPDSALSEDDTTDRVKEILSYLDNVDSKCDKTLENAKKLVTSEEQRTELEFVIESDIIEDVPKISDLLMLPNHQLARRIITLSLRSNELSNAIHLSKEHMANLRADKLKALRLEKQNGQNRIVEQKKHYENIVKRHQCFIEQLLKDKSALCDKVANLTRRLDSQNQAWEHKIETELARTKEITMAGEKIRREKWVRENTKKIKELTVKSFELEINKMTTEHQQHINDLKRKHQQDLLDTCDDLRRKFEDKEKTIRDSYTQDREGAIERERTAIRERFEKQLEEAQLSFEQQKARLLQEFTMERERIYAELHEKNQDYEARREQLLRERNDYVEQIKLEYKEKFQQQDIKNHKELLIQREQFEKDFAIWKREQEATFKLREVERENSIRQQCRLERDRQIDKIITNIDTEQLKQQQEFDIKLNRLKEKYENELKDSENNERIVREKYNETRSKLSECEATVQNLQSTMKQQQMKLDHSKKMCDEFINEKELFKETTKKELKNEIKTIQKERDNEIQRIYTRVQQAIDKKDSAVELLQKENNALKERCFKLEAIVRQQRKDYCTK